MPGNTIRNQLDTAKLKNKKLNERKFSRWKNQLNAWKLYREASKTQENSNWGAFHSTEFSKILVGNQVEHVNFWELGQPFQLVPAKVEIRKISKISCSIWRLYLLKSLTELNSSHFKMAFNSIYKWYASLLEHVTWLRVVPFGQWTYRKFKPVFSVQ